MQARNPAVDPGIGKQTLIEEASVFQQFLMTCFVGISLWNTLEMIPGPSYIAKFRVLQQMIYLTFKQYHTLYFWSICTATSGVPICCVAQILNNWMLGRPNLLPATLSVIGWIPMVTGQSLVLYSRLHLMYVEDRILRLVLAMIIFDALAFQGTTAVLTFGSNGGNPAPYLGPYSAFEKVQVTVFFTQEATISSIYLWKSMNFLGRYSGRLDGAHNTQRDRSRWTIRGILIYIILVNIMVVLLDATILVLEYLGLYLLQLSYKIFAYSVKLKVEIGILNLLVEFVKRTRSLDTELELTRALQREFESTTPPTTTA